MSGKTTNFLVYKDSDHFYGIATVELPELKKITAETKGSGYLGKSKKAIIGHFEELTTKIEFEELAEQTIDLMAEEAINLTFKANVTSDSGNVGLKVRIRGNVIGTTLGKLEAAEAIGQSIEIETEYIKITRDGVEKFELDKANFVYKINGQDMLETVRKNIGL